MRPFFPTTLPIHQEDDWHADRQEICRRRYGVIETVAGQLVAIHFRPWPKLMAWPEIWPVGAQYHGRGEADRCLLYYNRPLWHSRFLALRYIVSSKRTSYATFRAALISLDRVAELLGVDALLCDAANSRISDRLMRRFGWEPHKPSRWHRNYIKRFYGSYPSSTPPPANRLPGSPLIRQRWGR